MSTLLTQWAAVWGVQPAARADLTARLTLSEHPAAEAGRSEAAVQADIRLAASQRGDPVDVANFCAFLSSRGEGIAPETSTPTVAQLQARVAEMEAALDDCIDALEECQDYPVTLQAAQEARYK